LPSPRLAAGRWGDEAQQARTLDARGGGVCGSLPVRLSRAEIGLFGIHARQLTKGGLHRQPDVRQVMRHRHPLPRRPRRHHRELLGGKHRIHLMRTPTHNPLAPPRTPTHGDGAHGTTVR